MRYDIDCLLIGHNDIDFGDFVEQVETMGIESGSFQDLLPNYIYYQGKAYNAKQIYNMFSNGQNVDMNEVFSATIAYLGTYLNKHNLSFDYIKSFQDYKDELIAILKNKKIAVVGITTTLYVSVFPIIEIMNFIKEYNKDVKIVIGGPFVTTQYKALDPQSLQFLFEEIGADFYINSSQGELALVNVVKAVKGNFEYKNIDNIFYKNGDKYSYKQFVDEKNLLSENMVNWDLFKDVGHYVNLRASISCPFSCSFCAFPEHAGKYQVVSAEDIEKELDAIERKGTVKSVFFVDDTLNVPKERFVDMLKLMIRKKYSFNWYSHYRCQFATEEIVKLMKDSGCEGVFLGIESGSNKILQNMNKKVTTEQLKEGIRILNKYGIMIQASFIIGFPGETKETIQETIDFINNTDIDFYRVQLWYCDTTTRIYRDEKEKYGVKGAQFEWRHNTMDSKTAIQYLRDITVNITDKIRIPNYFDIDAVVRLKHSGVSVDKIREFLTIFNTCIKDKILYGNQENISDERINQFKRCLSTSEIIESNIQDEKQEEIEDFDFDF